QSRRLCPDGQLQLSRRQPPRRRARRRRLCHAHHHEPARRNQPCPSPALTVQPSCLTHRCAAAYCLSRLSSCIEAEANLIIAVRSIGASLNRSLTSTQRHRERTEGTEKNSMCSVDSLCLCLSTGRTLRTVALCSLLLMLCAATRAQSGVKNRQSAPAPATLPALTRTTTRHEV